MQQSKRIVERGMVQADLTGMLPQRDGKLRNIFFAVIPSDDVKRRIDRFAADCIDAHHGIGMTLLYDAPVGRFVPSRGACDGRSGLPYSSFLDA